VENNFHVSRKDNIPMLVLTLLFGVFLGIPSGILGTALETCIYALSENLGCTKAVFISYITSQSLICYLPFIVIACVFSSLLLAGRDQSRSSHLLNIMINAILVIINGSLTGFASLYLVILFFVIRRMPVG
jgi:hypothetical protein